MSPCTSRRSTWSTARRCWTSSRMFRSWTIARPSGSAGSPRMSTKSTRCAPMTVFAETPAVLGVGGYDWLAIWRQMYDAERVQTAVMAPGQEQASDHWANQAARFARATGRAPQPDHFLRFVLPYLQPSDTVLDIGAGAGRH